jgi:tRNA dimethylallyltransferase
MQQLIVIEGPTASGKTALGVALAKQLHTVVLSADSRQLYKEIAIGTAKPSKEEMQGVPHYFIDSHSITDTLTAGQFEQQALHLLATTLADFQTIILVGGSGMFIDALCNGLDPIPVDALMQEQLRNELATSGLEPLLAELKERDFAFYEQVDQHNSVRILRALEVIRATGKPFSTFRNNNASVRPFTVKRFVIDHPREQLYERINKRVDIMIENGLFAEVKAVEHLRESAALQTVGYKEVFDFWDGKYPTETECIDKIKQHTRNYAKRQLTWFKKHPEALWIPFTSTEKMSRTICEIIDNEPITNME